jgi:hypothetical protein
LGEIGRFTLHSDSFGSAHKGCAPKEQLLEYRNRHVEQNNRLALQASVPKPFVISQSRYLLVIYFFVDLDAQRLKKL